jgi:N-acetylated-alpha-linked acidic dipeptidase
MRRYDCCTMRPSVSHLIASLLIAACPAFAQSTNAPELPTRLAGFTDYTATEAKWDKLFLATPSAKLAGEHLKTLTQAPHVASSPEDYKTAEYVAKKFREDGLETEIVPYRVVIALPQSVHFEATAPGGFHETGPAPEHVDGDTFEDDKRILPPYNASSASGDVTADVIYANYGRPEDFKHLVDDLHLDLHGKLLIVRYGQNFRGVKAYLAQKYGAAGVLIYSDPRDDGYMKGDAYPDGPWRPSSGVQRGSVGYIFEYPGDPTTPGIASVPNLPDSGRTPLALAGAEPKVLAMPMSYADASPILAHLQGPAVPQEWQGGLPFTYHVGPGPVRVHLVVEESHDLHTIWDVIGKIPGTDSDGEFVVAGNHRDAWVYGATDPNSGTASMLEAAHGLGELLKAGWKPKRTIYLGSWDAEEEGLIGSTEWGEQHAREMVNCVAYFNVDVSVTGPDFSASASGSLKQFVRDVTKEVPSPAGGSVYSEWVKTVAQGASRHGTGSAQKARQEAGGDVPVDNLGGGSDYAVFLQHLGVPSTDFGSGGPYGVYHSAFDNYQWFTKFADPDFKLLQQQAGVFGLEVLHMADADVLPYDYVAYAREIGEYLDTARAKAQKLGIPLDEAAARAALLKFSEAAGQAAAEEAHPPKNVAALNAQLRQAETDLLDPAGLPNRDWYKHILYAPGEFTGYDAVVLPATQEALDGHNAAVAQKGLQSLTNGLERATATLQRASKK